MKPSAGPVPLVLLSAFTLALLARAATAGEEAPKVLDTKAPCANKTCHADFAKKKHVHGPIAVGECKACHVWKDNKHEFTIAREGSKLCISCHDDILIEEEKKGKEKEEGEGEDAEEKKLVVHEPVKEDCANCHDPHGANTKALLTAPVLELCETCHDETFAKAKAKTTGSTHSIILKGKACLSCHAVHTSGFEKLLASTANDMCLGCHDKEQKAGDRVIPSTKAEMAKKTLHGPLEDEGCVMCHDAHGSKHITMLKFAYPERFYAPFSANAYELCFQCHDEALAAAAQTEDETEFRNGKLNLHHLHVNKKVKGRTCRACHATHASDRPAQLRESIPFGRMSWKLPIGFEKAETGGSCASGCHALRAYDRRTPVKY
jgi:predicted CXXCH cytochrome family protein